MLGERTMTSIVRRTFVLIAVAGAVVLISGGNTISGQANNCGMQMNTQPVIFCDTFDAPHPVTNRSGQLNGTVWGVSRLAGGAPRWKDSTIEHCAGPRPASAVGATDVVICNGQLRQSTDDDTDVTVMAMYPKQPFDFTNRVGTVSFDVTNDTTGSHGAWPEFWITDLPVPAPMTHLIPCDMCSVPRNAIGIRFAANVPGWRADSIVVVRNHIIEDRNIFEGNTSGTKIQDKGWVQLSPGPNGPLNHVEIRISRDRIDIYASDPGSRTLKLINTVIDANLPITRGLVWIQDVHYNAEKAHEQDARLPNQKNHTYTWDNVAFDGPATYRDLSFDVLDNNVPMGTGRYRVGWDTTPSSPSNLQTLPMTAQNIAAATGAYLLFNSNSPDRDHPPSVYNYTINGNGNSQPSPFPSPSTQLMRGAKTHAFPVPLNQLVAGSQNVRISADVPISVQNVNIVLVAAAPVPGIGPTPSAPTNLRILR
jgi:hypothetical protein